jgi:hypothetical protein
MDVKTLRFLFAAVGFGALAVGHSFATELSDPLRQPASSEDRAKAAVDRPADSGRKSRALTGREQANGKPAEHTPDQHPVSETSVRTRGTQTTDKHHPGRKLPQPLQGKDEHPGAKQTSNVQPPTASAKTADPHRTGLNTSENAAKPGLTINKMEDHRPLPVARLSSLALVPPSQAAPRRGSGPAIIGGPAGSSARNTAVISGTGLKHRP